MRHPAPISTLAISKAFKMVYKTLGHEPAARDALTLLALNFAREMEARRDTFDAAAFLRLCGVGKA